MAIQDWQLQAIQESNNINQSPNFNWFGNQGNTNQGITSGALPDFQNYYNMNMGKQAFPHTGMQVPSMQPPGITASNVSGTDKGFFSKAKSMPLGLLNLLTRRQGATESFGGYPGGAESRAGLFPNEVTNLQRLADQDRLGGQGQDVFGTNVVSQFGDYDKAMEKNLGVFEKTMAQKGFNTLDELENYYMETYGPKSYILNKLRHVKGWPGQGGKGADDKKVPPIDKDTPVHHPQIGGNGGQTRDTSGWSSPGYTTRGGFTGTRGSQHGGAGTGQRGHHGNFSQGGRVGYNRGGRVGILAAF